MGPGPAERVPSLGVLSKGSLYVFKRASEKTPEDSEQLSRQARPGIKRGPSGLTALRAEPLTYWQGFGSSRIRHILQYMLKLF